MTAPGLSDLATLLAGMSPPLSPDRLVFATTPDRALAAGATALMRFDEDEGTTLILTADEAARLGLAAVFPCRRITLRVHSSLAATGFLAAISAELARHGLPLNPVAGFFHDHLFVPEDRADEAMAILNALAARR